MTIFYFADSSQPIFLKSLDFALMWVEAELTKTKSAKRRRYTEFDWMKQMLEMLMEFDVRGEQINPRAFYVRSENGSARAVDLRGRVEPTRKWSGKNWSKVNIKKQPKRKWNSTLSKIKRVNGWEQAAIFPRASGKKIVAQWFVKSQYHNGMNATPKKKRGTAWNTGGSESKGQTANFWVVF